ncbi:MAG: hypothetical protein LBS89_02885 [Zoogloeaceae bacterium]|jgi:hypothetical protein|nr:hypothetical protein [Zoogloeaceae bacterium]
MSCHTYDLLGSRALRRGFAWRFVFRRRIHPIRQPVDLTGCVARLEIYDTQHPRRAAWGFDTGLLGADGVTEFELTAADTADITCTAARYRVLFVDAEGEQTVYLTGRLAVLEKDL